MCPDCGAVESVQLLLRLSGFYVSADVSQRVSIPVLIGSGVTYDNVERYLHASGMIIGSHFKEGGRWAAAVDPEQVKRFMGKVRGLRTRGNAA